MTMTVRIPVGMPWACDPRKFGAEPTCLCSPAGYRWKMTAVPDPGDVVSYRAVCSTCDAPWVAQRWVTAPKSVGTIESLGTIGPPAPLNEPQIRFVPTRYQQDFIDDWRRRVLYGHTDPTILRLAVLETHIRRLRAALEACATPNEGWPESWIADYYEDSRKDVP